MTLTATSPQNLTPAETSPASTPGRWSPHLWAILLVAGLAMFLDALDVSMVGVALPSIGQELGLDTSALQWIVNGYILVTAAYCSSAVAPPISSAAGRSS
ncbi:hypothetical protein [Nocardia flavorosea]|uniref:hypothetical protein n=1 Tax=Nocardia flavorosea TaxID=53429 RepID=UPI002454C7BA|nr:hypothetical protein [Nocardia flavorosea]